MSQQESTSITNLPEPLSANVKGTFAYTTIKDRLPVTITKAIDFIHRAKNDLIKRYPDANILEDAKGSIYRLSELRYELTTDKPFRKLEDTGEDLNMWNNACIDLKARVGEQNCTWFRGSWLFAECYLYRRMRECMLLCESQQMRDYDPFEMAKWETNEMSKTSVHSLIKSLCPLDMDDEVTNLNVKRERFRIIVEALLWANKNDLSLSSGNDVSSRVKNLVELLDSFKENILCDHTQEMWSHLTQLKKSKTSHRRRVDVILDNCGIELAADLIFCDFLLRNQLVDVIHLHPKAYQWFVSDVCQWDFDHLMRLLSSDNSLHTNKFYTRLKKYMSDSRLVLEKAHPFWTSPYDFNDMKQIAPDLYETLESESSFLLIKGDLNYRKLIGDLNWPYQTPLAKAVRDFKPTSLCAVRTCKADLLANLNLNLDENVNYAKLLKLYPNTNKWMNTGDYGVIQLVIF